MKFLLIGGTGTISSAITRQLAETEHEVYVLNRGNHNSDIPKTIKTIVADINNEEQAKEAMRLASNKLPIKCKFVTKADANEEV